MSGVIEARTLGSGSGKSIKASGWVSDSNTWTFSSDDAPSYVISINADMTGILQVKHRIKLTHAAAVKYFIVTAVGAYSGGVTLVTVYGGTDYTLAATAITLPYYSPVAAPFGFPSSPAKWTVEVTDTSFRVKAPPGAGTWYYSDFGSINISVPIGCWKLSYSCLAMGVYSAAYNGDVYVSLSTANNSESDIDFTGGGAFYAQGGSFVNREKIITVAAKTPYYIIVKSTTAISGLYLYNDTSKCIVRALCAYL